MATLTASGITTSSGQMDGYYTGTTSTNTSFPLGQLLWAYNSNNAYITPMGNSTARVLTGIYQQGYLFWNGTGGSALSGTWKCIGCMNNDTCSNPMRVGSGSVLIQRVA